MNNLIERTWPNWFTGQYAEAAFARNLTHLADRPGLRVLQVGVYAGDASVWLADKVLTGAGSFLFDVDTWRGSQNEAVHRAIDFDLVFRYYQRRIPSNVMPLRMSSDEFFAMRQEYGPYDFIYIDGDHDPRQVLRDAIHAEEVLAPGGILAFDDYSWFNHDVPRDIPQPAIDAFIRCYEKQFDVIEIGQQAWLRKR